jgi:hypothetical protein
MIKAFNELSYWMQYEFGSDRKESVERRTAIVERFKRVYGESIMKHSHVTIKTN